MIRSKEIAKQAYKHQYYDVILQYFKADDYIKLVQYY